MRAVFEDHISPITISLLSLDSENDKVVAPSDDERGRDDGEEANNDAGHDEIP